MRCCNDEVDTTHRLRLATSPAGLLFECEEGCGRRLAVDRASGKLTVLDRGDQMVEHYGSSEGVELHPSSIRNA
jgi:hypothetical protein